MLISNGEEEEQRQLSASVQSETAYGVGAGRQSGKSGAECSQQEPLLKPCFLFIFPKYGSEYTGVKRKSELFEIVNVRVGYGHE